MPDPRSPRYSIVIPAYNEEARIDPTLRAYAEYFPGAEILVVLNGCRDRTIDHVRAAQKKYANISVLEIEEPVGKGGALRAGFCRAAGEFVSFVDADGATAPRHLSALFEAVGDADGAIASRWLPGSVVALRQPYMRRFASRVFNVFVVMMFGLPFRDTQCGAKVFRGSALRRILGSLEISNFACDVELLNNLRRHGSTIKEVPTTWTDVLGSRVHVPAAARSMLMSLVRLRIRESPFRSVIPWFDRMFPTSPMKPLADACETRATTTALADGKISVVMPAFNESEHIFKNLKEVVETFIAFDCDFEVILVDDGSPDNTHLHAARLLLEHPEVVRVVRYEENQGKGNALMAGTAYARGDYVVFLDADMDLHPSQLPTFFERMKQTRADAVIGSKRHPESNVNYPFVRQIYSAGYYFLVWLLFRLPLKDTQTGLKLFRMELLRDVFPRVLAKRFAFDIEVLSIAHALGYKIVDAPVQLQYQRNMGRIKGKAVWVMLLDTLAIFYRLRILKYYNRANPEAVISGVASARELFAKDVERSQPEAK